MTKGNFKSGCVICGLELEYLKNNEEMQCFFCGQVSRSNVRCVNNHYVCDRCHSLSANDFIEHICIKTELKDPLQLALSIMMNENIKMHGPEHHFLVPAVLLACYYNVVYSNYSEIKEKKIRAARERGEDTGRFLWYPWKLRGCSRNWCFYESHNRCNTPLR